MKTLRLGPHGAIFATRDPHRWAGLGATWDYHNWTADLTLLTVSVGVEWVWGETRPGKRKGGFDWAIWRAGGAGEGGGR